MLLSALFSHFLVFKDSEQKKNLFYSKDFWGYLKKKTEPDYVVFWAGYCTSVILSNFNDPSEMKRYTLAELCWKNIKCSQGTLF